MKMIYNVEDKLSFKQTLVYSLQQFLAVVCATILVPILSSGNGVNMSPAAALFGAGIATLFYVWVTKKKSPMFIGSSFAFLGVNGAGKSTTISIMCGTLSKDGGEVIIDGMNVDNDMKSITKEIGVVYQTSALDAKLSVKDNLTSRASLYGITGKAAKERIAALSESRQRRHLRQQAGRNALFSKVHGIPQRN